MIIPITIRLHVIILLLLIANVTIAQNRKEAQRRIDRLCADDFSGRGYINQGDSLAANYIASEFESIGLENLSNRYLQSFNMSVNTFNVAECAIDGKVLVPGYDFLVAPNSGSVKQDFEIFYISPMLLKSPKIAKKVKKAIKKGMVPVISQYDKKNEILTANVEEIRNCNEGATLIFLKESLIWSVAMSQAKGEEIWLVDSIFNRFSKKLSINVSAKFIENYQSQNVLGYSKGTLYPDSFIVFCGHYDHLGKMGEATFYGANDNASGIAMLLDMASYFVKHPQNYSIAFIAFGAEEAGLVGSYNYVKKPLVPLKKTKFVFNMDLMGSGEEGATIVNGTVFKEEFDELVFINTANEYLPKIKSRGKAANSDHYFFTEAGVHSFFIYLLGEYKHYHIPADNPENLILGEYYDKSFLLIRDFIISQSNK